MRHAAQNVLRQRVCRWRECGEIFWICRSCDRGHCYCSDRCRQKARREQRRVANLRHQRTPEGRLDHRDRQRTYRRRKAKDCVTDQGSFGVQRSGNIVVLEESPPIAALKIGELSRKNIMILSLGVPYCIICGRPGRFVNPFHQRR
jgi:hypothetical protein